MRRVWDGNNPLHEWVEMAPEEPKEAEPSFIPYEEIVRRQRLAALGSIAPNAPPPPEQGTKDQPITWVFDPDSFAPAAKLVGDKTYSIVTDYLGTPTLMIDDHGREVWSADISVWGKLRNQNGEKQHCPFRWPGQYEDEETGLYYNRFRYYDPDTGQYVSQDPIGLVGGIELYQYVADVCRQTDILGLIDKVFWSGGPRAKDAAEKFANEIGGEILEITPTGKAMETFTNGMDWSEAEPLWQKTSQTFAGSAPSSQKKAVAFIDSTRYRGASSVWEQFEKPILEKKGIFIEVRDVANCP